MPDFNLLTTLDVLLTEGSVAKAARRLRLSPSAMSRALQRLRETTGDPLLVRAGRGLMPTPRAVELRAEVGPLVRGAEAVLRPAALFDLGRISRTFTLRTGDGFVETFGPALLARVRAEAPGIRLRFLPRTERDSASLRDGTVDLETGVIGSGSGPELMAQTLFRDRFVAVVREGHALARKRGGATLEAYLKAEHILVSRGTGRGPIEAALDELGRQRRIVTEVGSFGAALALARGSDLVATVPERHTGTLREGTAMVRLPFEVPPIAISLLWHPRMDADPAHRWLRGCLRDICGETRGGP